MPIPNDTYALTLDAGYLHGAHLALLHRDGPLIPQSRPAPRPRPRIDTTTVGYRLAATNSRLRTAVNLAVACLRTGRDREALDVLEAA